MSQKIQNENMIGNAKNSKKGRSFLKGLIIFIAIIILIIIGIGFMFPGLLWNKNLGVKYTNEDYDSITNKLESGSENVELTSEEITAFLNQNSQFNNVIKNGQVRINNDGTMDFVGTANIDTFLKEFLDNKITKQQLENEIPFSGIIPENVNISLNASGSIDNNKSAINVNSVNVQGVSIPDNFINSDEAQTIVTSILNNMLSNYNSNAKSSFNELIIDSGTVILK